MVKTELNIQRAGDGYYSEGSDGKLTINGGFVSETYQPYSKQNISTNTLIGDNALNPIINAHNNLVDKVEGNKQDAASLTEENNFTGRNIFNSETQFNAPVNSSSDIVVTNSVFKVLDNTDGKDIVTQYGADKIITEENNDGTSYIVKLPKKSGTLALTTDVSEVAIDNSTITKSADGKLQAVGLKNDSVLLTAEQIWLACSIERTV